MFGEPVATAGDRLWAIAVYVLGWISAIIALVLWREPQ
jgi:hypothetical protein